jgi:hypothetical protein
MAPGLVSPPAFQAQLGGVYGLQSYYDRARVVVDSGSDKSLRITMLANSASSESGVSWGLELPLHVNDACIEYDVRFSPTFNWSLGGKIPGLAGCSDAIVPHYPGIASGHNTPYDLALPGGGVIHTMRAVLGWSGRALWFATSTVKAFLQAGHKNMAVGYVYHYGMTDASGDILQWNHEFQKGTWHKVKMCYKMNSVNGFVPNTEKGTPVADGVYQSWVDGKPGLSFNNYIYRARPDVKVSSLLFSAFRGGQDLIWASPTEDYVDFDNFLITTSP